MQFQKCLLSYIIDYIFNYYILGKVHQIQTLDSSWIILLEFEETFFILEII